MALQSSTAIHLDVPFSSSPANCGVGDNPAVDQKGSTDDAGERDGKIRMIALDIRRQVHAGYLHMDAVTAMSAPRTVFNWYQVW